MHKFILFWMLFVFHELSRMLKKIPIENCRTLKNILESLYLEDCLRNFLIQKYMESSSVL